ncbi:hypothetical protein VTI74DRAFT_1501 [Chaetomium olivicolor]
MAPRKSPRNLSQDAQKTPEKAAVIEIVSDSEPEAHDAEDGVPEITPETQEVIEQPLLRAAGIKYKTGKLEEETEQDRPQSPSSAKLAVRVRDTGSAKHRHVSIEIPLPTSSEMRRRKTDAEDSEEDNVEEVFKTPRERKHITFDDVSDHDEYVTPREAPSMDPLEGSIPKPTEAKEDDEDEEEESDDDAPPEAVSTRAAEAETQKAAQAAAKAAEQQAAALKRKRQERDAFFKQQAEERKRTQKPTIPEEEDESAPEPAQETKTAVPKLLPQLLESDDEDDVAQQLGSAASGKNKRRKLGGIDPSLLREPKLPKDKRMGSTAYRVVAGTGDGRLAPKLKQQSRNLKETLLRRDRVAQPRGGFFVRNR